MVSARPPISNSCSSLIKPLGIVLSTPVTIGIAVSLMFNSFFVFFRQGLGTYLSFSFALYGLLKRQNPIFVTLSLVFLSLSFSLSCQLSYSFFPFFSEIRGSVCISKSQRISCISFSQNRFRFLQILFGWMTKFQFFAQFSVDYLSHPVMSSFVLFLC